MEKLKITQVNNLSNDIYHNSAQYKNYWSSSNIKNYLISPREALFQKKFAKKIESEALDFGNMVHDFLASKHVNGQAFGYNIFEPPINPSTGAAYHSTSQKYKDAAMRIENPISVTHYKAIMDIYQMIQDSDYAWYMQKEVLGKGIAEASFFVEGLHPYKYRPDVITEKNIFDYKTISKKDFTIERIHYVIKERGHDISAAMYQYFEHKRTDIWKPFILIWIMKEPPYDILISDISGYAYEINNDHLIVNSGALVFQKLKDQHELCQLSNSWPGLANQFDSYKGLRRCNLVPRYDRTYEQFEINN